MKRLLFALLLVSQGANAGLAVIWGKPFSLMLNGGMKFQETNTTALCDASTAGSMRNNAGTIQFCNGVAWYSPSASSGGTVSSVVGGTGLTGGTITSSGTLAVDVGTSANKIVQLNGSAQYPAADGSLITNVNAVKLQGRPISSVAPSSAQILAWNNAALQWEPQSPAATGVTSVVSGTGLVAGTITSSGTLNVDVGFTANKIFQFDGNARIPSDLIPTDDAAYNLGDNTHRWGIAYVLNAILAGTGRPSIAMANGALNDSAGLVSIDWVSRWLVSPAQVMLDWSQSGTLNASTNKITNVVNPTSAQDAATKSYVDSSLTNMNAFVNGGNAFGANATLGTTDNRSLALLTNNSAKVLISASGNVGIGTLTPATTFNVSAAQSAQAFFDNYGFASSIIGRRADGTPSAPTAVLSAEPILNLGARGYGATGFAGASTGSYRIYAAENFTDSAMGTYLSLHTAPVGSITQAERLRITDSGFVGIGTLTPTSLVDARLTSADPAAGMGTVMSSTATTSYSANSTVGSVAIQSIMNPSAAAGANVTGGIYSIFTQALVPSGSGTGVLNSLFGQRIQYGISTGGGGTVTSAYGLNIVPVHQAGTITTSYGIRISAPNTGGTVGTEYGIAQDSTTAKNFFSGLVGIGNTNPTISLIVSSNASGSPVSTGNYVSLGATTTFTDSATAASGTAANYTHTRIAGGTLAATNSPVTTTEATSLRIQPVASGANETITNGYGMHVVSVAVAPSGAMTNSYGIKVDAATGATNNYAASFTGGNVGISTTSPVNRLEVDETSGGNAGTSVPDGIMIKDSSTGSTWDLVNPWAVLDFVSGDASTKGVGVRYRIGPVMTNATGGSDRLGFFSAPTTASTMVERMTISEAGNVGIGTTSPTNQLELQAASAGPATLLMSTDGLTTGGRTNLGFQTLGAGTATPTQAGTKGWILSTRGDAYTVAAQQNDMIFFKYNGTTTTEPLYIDYATENVGIGTQLIQPTNRLDVNGAVAIGTSYAANATAPANGLAVQGNVGIGTATPLHSLDVYGDCIAFNGTCIGAANSSAITYIASALRYGGIGTQTSALTRFIGGAGTAIATTDTDGLLVTTSGTLQYAYVGADTNTINGNTVFTIMKNSVASAFTVTLGSSATAANDTVSTLSVAAGDRISIRVVTAGSSGTLTRPMFSVALNATVNTTGGTVTSIISGTGLVAGTITSAGTLNVDVGSTANKIVQLNASAQLPANQIKAGGSSATATVNANAGVGASCSVSNATDVAGTISLTTTAITPAAGEQCKVNFANAYAVAPICVFSAADANAANDSVIQGTYITSSTIKASLNFASAELVGRTYTFTYHCIETK